MEDLTAGLEGYDVIEPAVPVRQGRRRGPPAEDPVADLAASFGSEASPGARGRYNPASALDDTLDLSASFGALEDLNLDAVRPPAGRPAAAAGRPVSAGQLSSSTSGGLSGGLGSGGRSSGGGGLGGTVDSTASADDFEVEEDDFLEESIDSLPDGPPAQSPAAAVSANAAASVSARVAAIQGAGAAAASVGAAAPAASSGGRPLPALRSVSLAPISAPSADEVDDATRVAAVVAAATHPEPRPGSNVHVEAAELPSERPPRSAVASLSGSLCAESQPASPLARAPTTSTTPAPTCAAASGASSSSRPGSAAPSLAGSYDERASEGGASGSMMAMKRQLAEAMAEKKGLKDELRALKAEVTRLTAALEQSTAKHRTEVRGWERSSQQHTHARARLAPPRALEPKELARALAI